MANSIQLITKYLQNAIDTVFAAESKTKILENGQKFLDVSFKEAGWVKVFSLLTDGLSPYYRANSGLSGATYTHYPQGDGYKVGNVEGSWELFKLEFDRGKQFQIDSMDDEETAGLVIGNLLTEFLRTKVVPEVDAVRFSKLAAKANATLGNLVSGDIAANAIIADFNSAFEWLTEHEVPSDDQVIFVNPSVMTLIRNTDELYKKLSQAEYKDESGATFTIRAYEGRPIIEVPSSRFFTNVICGENGYYASTNSRVINYMIVSKKAAVPIVKLEKTKIWSPEQVQDFDGYKVNIRIYHDLIIPRNKICGVYVSVGSTVATTRTSRVDVDLTYSNGSYLLNEYYTTPAGIWGTVVYSTTALTVGGVYASGDTNKVIARGETFEKIGTETAGYFALVDAANNIVAVSERVTLPTA